MIPQHAIPVAEASTHGSPQARATGSRTSDLTGMDLGVAHATSSEPSTVSVEKVAQRYDLVSLARPVLSLVPALKATPQIPDAFALRASLAQAIRAFDEAARASGVPVSQVLAARYVLCTLVDEVAARTPWGSGGVWGRHSLLAMFHHETEGGERVFQLMTALTRQPRENDGLLMLIHVALALGFRGRLGVIDGGMVRLAAVRERLGTVIRRARGASSSVLSVQPRRSTGRHLVRWADVPLWRRPAWLALLALFVSVTAFAVAAHAWLTNQSASLERRIEALRLPLSPQVVHGRSPSAPIAATGLPPLWTRQLDADRAAAHLTMRATPLGAAITVHGDGLFEPGSAKLQASRQELIGRVGQALAVVPGVVTITGHTDDQQIRGGPFRSNQALSEARALEVRNVLVTHGVDAGRLVVRGAGDDEPIASNHTQHGRAQNRRVDLVWERPKGH